MVERPVVGSLPASRLVTYMALAPDGERKSLEQLQPSILATPSPAAGQGCRVAMMQAEPRAANRSTPRP